MIFGKFSRDVTVNLVFEKKLAAPSSGLRSKSSRKPAEAAVCCPGFLLNLLLDPEDRCDVFLHNMGAVPQLHSVTT